MNARVGLFGFGRSVEMIFFDSKEARREKVIRRSYKLKNRFAPEFLAADEDAEESLELDSSQGERSFSETGRAELSS